MFIVQNFHDYFIKHFECFSLHVCVNLKRVVETFCFNKNYLIVIVHEFEIYRIMFFCQIELILKFLRIHEL